MPQVTERHCPVCITIPTFLTEFPPTPYTVGRKWYTEMSDTEPLLYYFTDLS